MKRSRSSSARAAPDANAAPRATFRVTVPVFFHVIHDGDDIVPECPKAQVDVLADAFGGVRPGLRRVIRGLLGVPAATPASPSSSPASSRRRGLDRTPPHRRLVPGAPCAPSGSGAIMRELAVDPATTLNAYTPTERRHARLINHFPETAPGTTPSSVFLLHSTLPGGSNPVRPRGHRHARGGHYLVCTTVPGRVPRRVTRDAVFDTPPQRRSHPERAKRSEGVCRTE